ncbi:hypothetical protein [Cucumibacter marinus]|uniref:hypothetical protein n=1 Tax=Cucumibacter marinus TaxID=1121252 RepID=UPI00041062C8|nr:hypothetical protein [Cucumibacter marinus]
MGLAAMGVALMALSGCASTDTELTATAPQATLGEAAPLTRAPDGYVRTQDGQLVAVAPVAEYGSCQAGQVPLTEGPPPAPTGEKPLSPSLAANSMAGEWIITDTATNCGCVVELGEPSFGRPGVTPKGCQNPALKLVRRYDLGRTETGIGAPLALLAADGQQVVLQLTRDGLTHFTGTVQGRSISMWRPTN